MELKFLGCCLKEENKGVFRHGEGLRRKTDVIHGSVALHLNMGRRESGKVDRLRSDSGFSKEEINIDFKQGDKGRDEITLKNF